MISKVMVKGDFHCKILYVPLNDSKPVHNMMSLLPIEENVNMDGVTKGDHIKAEYAVEEMKITPINTRKINIKAIIQVKVMVDEKKTCMCLLMYAVKKTSKANGTILPCVNCTHLRKKLIKLKMNWLYQVPT